MPHDSDKTAAASMQTVRIRRSSRNERRRATVRVRRDERAVVLLEVKDNGIGISPEDLPYVFARFYRASKDRPQRASGADLGLATARSIAHQHNGEIESEPGRASTARLFLPAA